jgi:crotonobetainyl-CoA:carnitine CoA-transferase CaiB-like acyl-CoA transferase/N-acetylglutamate synthase-like GNAT family acetyltransferase
MFENLKVIELASVLAGPLVGSFFSELGAEVIKIENPETGGDTTRFWKNPKEDPSSPFSAYYLSANWGKKSIFLNLKEKGQREELYTLIKDADIVISNYKAGDCKKLGVDYEELTKINPRLIYAEITGFPEGINRTAFDVVLQAETGFMSINGTQESGPIKMPVALIDVLTAHQLKEAVLLALLNKEKTGEGAKVSVSLYEAAISSLANQASNWLSSGFLPERTGSLHPNIAPYGETFLTSDKKHIVLAVGNNKQFQDLCKVLGLENVLSDAKFSGNFNRVQNRYELEKMLAVHIFKYDSIYLGSEFTRLNVPFGIIKNIQEVFEEPAAKILIRKEFKEEFCGSRVKTIAFKTSFIDEYEIIEPSSPEDLEKYYQLRWEVLRNPWNKPKGSEKDDMEEKCIHAMVINRNKEALAVCRLQFNNKEEAQIRYMGVRSDMQGKGIGKKVLKYLEGKAKERNIGHIVLDARENAVNFYESMGYKIIAKGHLLWEEIQHYVMKKDFQHYNRE